MPSLVAPSSPLLAHALGSTSLSFRSTLSFRSSFSFRGRLLGTRVRVGDRTEKAVEERAAGYGVGGVFISCDWDSAHQLSVPVFAIYATI